MRMKANFPARDSLELLSELLGQTPSRDAVAGVGNLRLVLLPNTDNPRRGLYFRQGFLHVRLVGLDDEQGKLLVGILD